ncbi:serine/threonine-protein kinase [Blastococcus sp. TF02A-26]|uniref:serine/threonine-protein kinase n=1 Tax=Blastococcus sp. TF02A-26 TaxID=2250577 RepID=UPI001F3CFC0D|nr:serine/threonine-protein kinase [Blastococcus sp. TF02A-26]
MQPGTSTIADRYEPRVLLATGGMGQVWRAHDTRLGRDVALKVLRSEFTGDPSFLARFRAEARHTAVLSHPNIATLYDYGEVPAGPDSPEHLAYLVMELVEGESLSQLLAREGRLEPRRAADVLRQTAAGLGAAHALGVVHRDVKPGNVLVARDGTVKLTDFGIASSAASVPLTGTGQIIGTAHYLSPEQAQGASATPASDVYALGLVGWEMLAGRRAFDGESSVQVALRQITDFPPPLPDEVPVGLRNLLDRAMVKDPAQRIPDGAAFRQEVEGVLAGRVPDPVDRAATAVLPPHLVAAPPDGTRVLPPVGLAAASGGPAPRPAAHSRRGLAAALAALALLAALAVVLVLTLGDDDPRTGDAGPTTSAPSTSAPSTTAAPEPEVVEIDERDYLDRPVGEVQAELTLLGLTVQLRPVTTGDAADGAVLAVSPDGELAVGDTVTVTHVVAPPPPPAPAPAPAPSDDDGGDDDSGGGDDDGGGNGNEGGGNGTEGGGNGTEGNQGNGNGNGGGNDIARGAVNGNGGGNGNGNGGRGNG